MNIHANLSIVSIPDSSYVFFSVAADDTEDYSIGDIIKFPHTFSNVNPGFPGWNPATNMFTCPYSGYYMFIVNLYKGDDAIHNSNYVAVLTMSDAGDMTQLYNHRALSVDGYVTFTSSMCAFVLCNQGEHVWVEMRSDDVNLFDSSAHRNQFSGFLIKEGLE